MRSKKKMESRELLIPQSRGSFPRTKYVVLV